MSLAFKRETVKSDMKVLRWVLLGLYIVLVIGLLGIGYSGNSPEWIFLTLDVLEGEPFWTIFVLAVTVISQAVFILVPGTINLCRPIRRRRLLAPVIIASLMVSLLVGALFASLTELLDVQTGNWFIYVFWTVIGVNWVIWSIVFFARCKDMERYKILRHLVRKIIGGSLIELLAAIPSHAIVSRRPGCFVGMATGSGIVAGIVVMLWAFGPGIILLFLREKRKTELERV